MSEHFYLDHHYGIKLPDMLTETILPNREYCLQKVENIKEGENFIFRETVLFIRGNNLHREDGPAVVVTEKCSKMRDCKIPKAFVLDSGIQYPVSFSRPDSKSDSIYRQEQKLLENSETVNYGDMYKGGDLYRETVSQIYFVNGRIHRENGPALTYRTEISDYRPKVMSQKTLFQEPVQVSPESKEVFVCLNIEKYVVNNDLHNMQGPAFIYDFKDMIRQKYDFREYFYKEGISIDPHFFITPNPKQTSLGTLCGEEKKEEKKVETGKFMTAEDYIHEQTKSKLKLNWNC